MAAIGHALEMDSDKAARLLPVTKPVWRRAPLRQSANLQPLVA